MITDETESLYCNSNNYKQSQGFVDDLILVSRILVSHSTMLIISLKLWIQKVCSRSDSVFYKLYIPVFF